MISSSARSSLRFGLSMRMVSRALEYAAIHAASCGLSTSSKVHPVRPSPCGRRVAANIGVQLAPRKLRSGDSTSGTWTIARVDASVQSSRSESRSDVSHEVTSMERSQVSSKSRWKAAPISP